jgi:hypothetical protein
VVVHLQAAPEDGKVEAIRFCPDSSLMNSAVRGDFPRLVMASKFNPCTHPCHSKTKDHEPLAEKETAMNVETVELKAVAEVAKTDEAIEVLALSLDDLDIVAGGASLGALC